MWSLTVQLINAIWVSCIRAYGKNLATQLSTCLGWSSGETHAKNARGLPFVAGIVEHNGLVGACVASPLAVHLRGYLNETGRRGRDKCIHTVCVLV